MLLVLLPVLETGAAGAAGATDLVLLPVLESSPRLQNSDP
jgi:hypothetical protein